MQYDERLRRHERITEEHEYKAVIKRGKLVAGKAFKAYLLVGKELDRKAGFIAGKAVGGACERNRAKRVLKEAYRRLKPNLEPKGFKIVFIAKQASAHLKSHEIRQEMAEKFEKIGLLRTQS